MKTAPFVALALSLLAPVLAGCGQPPSPTQTDAAADSAQSYSTRGVVRGLPDPAQPGSSLQIRHEPVPGFRDADGEVVGMQSMTMPFPADAALLQDVAVGDKVSFDFVVRWTGNPPMEVTRLEVLPPDTALEFEAPAD